VIAITNTDTMRKSSFGADEGSRGATSDNVDRPNQDRQMTWFTLQRPVRGGDRSVAATTACALSCGLVRLTVAVAFLKPRFCKSLQDNGLITKPLLYTVSAELAGSSQVYPVITQ